MLEHLASSAAVSLLNRLLAREPAACAKLASFAGRSARFEALPFVLGLAVTPEGSFAAATGPGEPSVTIAIDAAALPNLVLDPPAIMRKVSLSGDAEFAQVLSQVLQGLRPEPEEELSRFVGDVAAVRIVGFVRAALAQARESGARLAGTAADYFVAENPLLAPRAELEQFGRDVSAVRDAVERLDKRVGRLESPAADSTDSRNSGRADDPGGARRR